jgi:hypothetical protein
MLITPLYPNVYITWPSSITSETAESKKGSSLKSFERECSLQLDLIPPPQNRLFGAKMASL